MEELATLNFIIGYLTACSDKREPVWPKRLLELIGKPYDDE